jgi:hypothetical protein
MVGCWALLGAAYCAVTFCLSTALIGLPRCARRSGRRRTAVSVTLAVIEQIVASLTCRQAGHTSRLIS